MCLHTLIGALYVVIPALFALGCNALAWLADICPIPEEEQPMVTLDEVKAMVVKHHSERAIRAVSMVAYWHEQVELAVSEEQRRKAMAYRDVWSNEAFDRRVAAIEAMCG